MIKKKNRESNIELLRIFAICGVVMLHYNNPLCGGAIAYALGVNRYFLIIFECISISAVNVFVLISGYFLCDSNMRNLHRPLELIIQIIAVNEVFYLIRVIIGQVQFSIKAILANMIPTNWFIMIYIALYLLSPLLNVMWNKIEEKHLEKSTLTLLMVLFSVYPILVDILSEITGRPYNGTGLSTIGAFGNQAGYTIVNFCMMYLFGAFLKKESRKHDGGILRLLIYVSILFVWALTEKNIEFVDMVVWEYCNPIVLLLAVEFFLIFKKMNLGSNKFINIISRASLMVYLINWNILPHLRISKYVSGGLLIMIVHIIASVVGVYLFCLICWLIYDWIMKSIYSITINKIPFLNKNLYEGL